MIKRVFSKMTVGHVITNIVRLILIIGFISSLNQGRDLAVAFTIIAFVSTFISKILSNFGIKTGTETQIIILLKGFAALALSFIGLTVILSLKEQELLDTSTFMTISLAFALSFTLGAIWEIIEFSLDNLFGFALQQIGTGVVVLDLIIDASAAFIVSAGGYIYQKKGIWNRSEER